MGAVLHPAPARAAAPQDGTGLVIGADLSFLPQEEAHGAVFRDSAGVADAIQILERHGLDYARLRLWHSPSDGHSGLAEVLGMALRLRQRGLGLLLDLHYSDTWADPGKQSIPAAWAGLGPAALEDSVYRYTRDVVAALAAQGTPPDIVQLGNEITGGMLWDRGRVGGSFDTPEQWQQLGALLKAAARGARESAPGVRVMLHVDCGGDAATSQWFFDHVVAEGVSFDVIGLSYYPWWHGTLESLAQNLAALANRYDRDLFVVETSYPWTLDDLDGEGNIVGLPGQLLAGFAATPIGQAAFLRRLVETVSATPRGHGRGVFTWAPDWVSAPGLGSAGENLALFDGSGRLLPGADALAATNARLDDVFYQYMPIAWRDSDADAHRFGDFGGMTAALPYLRGLGITAVWMTPIFTSPAYHGYQHMPPNQLNPWFGTEPQFLEFVHSAHAESVGVFIDLVAYHTSQRSAFFRDSYGNPSSPSTDLLAYRDAHVANRDYDGGWFTTWNGDSVAYVKWDLSHPATTDSLVRWTSHWLDPDGDGDPSDGIAGYRCDHVMLDEGWGYTAGWWQGWKRALEQTSPGVFTFAEQGDWGSHGAEFLLAHDATFAKPFESAARGAIASGSAAPLYSEMRATLASLPPGRLYLCTLGNHDVNRLMSVLGDDWGRAKAAAAVLMTQPLPPILYFGDELGMRGTKGEWGTDANDIPMREPFKWNAVMGPPMTDYWTLNAPAWAARYEQDHDGRSVEEQQGVPGSLLETYRGLIRARREHVALRRGGYAEVPNSSASVWAFARHAARRETLLVAINLSGSAVNMTLDLSAFAVTDGRSVVRDVLSGDGLADLTTANQSAYALSLPAYGWRILNAAVTPVPAPPSTLDGRDIPSDFGTGTLVATQDAATGMGDNVNELDRVYARAESMGLRLGITGNLGTDGTALALLFDSGGGGQGTLRTATFGSPPSGVPQLDGLVMDAGFEPGVMLWMNGWGGTLYVDRFELGPSGGGSKRYVGSSLLNSGASDLSGGANTNGMQAAFDDGNTLGVTATEASGAATATRGLEALLPWADLGASGPGGTLRMMAMIVRPDGSIGNQFLPGLGAGHSNLGLAPLSLRDVPDTQYAVLSTTLAGEPGTAARLVGIRAWPNPFHDSTTLRFALGRAARVRIEILDAAGRRVRDLGSRLLDAGPQVIGWDGDDDAGRKVGPAIYLMRVTTPEGAIKGKLVRLR